MPRLSIKPEIARSLFALSGNKCAFPGCNCKIISDNNTFIAQLCHIEAANEGGPRYNLSQTDEERRSAANLLLLCYEHHKETDDEKVYTVERLREIKKAHEDQFRQNQYEISQAILENVLSDLHSQLGNLYDISKDTNNSVREIKELLNKSLTQPSFDENKFYISQLDSIKELKKQGKLRTVIDLLLDFKKKNWQSLSPETKYKVLVNLGMCYFDLHNKTKACEALLELKDIPHETTDSLAYICLAAAIKNHKEDFEIYFTKTKVIDRNNINLWVAYTERYKNEKSVENILKEIPKAVAATPQLLFSIGEIFCEHGNKKQGITILKKALKKLNDNSDSINDTQAVIATWLIKDIIDPFKFLYRTFSVEEKADLEEARNLFTESWAKIKNTEMAQSKWYIILNRGVIYKITGDKNLALSDFLTAYELSKDFLPFKNLLLMQLQLGNLEAAEQLLLFSDFKRDLNEDEIFEMHTFKSRLLCLKGKYREAVQILTDYLDESNETRYFEILTVIVSIYFENKSLQDAAPYCELLKTKFPNCIAGFLFSGYMYLKLNDKEKAFEYYDHAALMVTDKTQHQEIYELASGYLDLEEFEKAIPYFEKITNQNIYNEFSKGLIHAWYQSGNLQSAHSLAEELFAANPKEPYLAEIIGNVYQETKNYDKAIAITEEFLLTASGAAKEFFLFRGARFYSYKRDWENVKRLAVQIKDVTRFSMDDIFALAYLLIKAGEEQKGMQMAFDARTRFFDQSDTHLKYISISINIKKEEEELFPLIVAEECAVIIKSESGKEQTFLITHQNAKGENVLNPEDGFACQLIGKSVGEELVVKKGFDIDYRITISSVMDIYVFAFRESMAMFETRFAGEHNVGVFRAKPGQPDDQVEQVVKASSLGRSNFQKQVYNLYNQRLATIGLLAGLFKRNTVKQWLSVITSPDVFMINYSHDETAAIEQVVRDNKRLVIDLTALLTNFFLYPDINFFSLFHNDYIISQSTIDDLQEFYDELEDYVNDGMLTLGYQNGRMIANSLSSEDIIHQRKKIADIIEWCRTNATISAPAILLKINRKIRKRSAEIFGDAFYDTILLAQEHDAFVISDDDTFKNVLRSENKIPSFSTYQLVTYLEANKKITQHEFEKFSFQLILGNNIFIPITSEQLWNCFDISGFQIRKPFNIAVKGLLILVPHSCAINLAAFLRKLYLEAGLTVTRQQTVLFVFGEISKRHDFASVKNLLIKSIVKEFRFLPNFKDELLELLQAF